MTPRVRSLSVVAALAALAGVLTALPARADEGFAFERVAGTDRYATAAQMALATPDTGTAAVVATGESFPDALAAAFLAGVRSAPILLASRAALPSSTAAALRDLGTTSVTVLGGTGAVGDGVLDQLRSSGYAVSRLAGNDRYDTARRVAEAGGSAAVGTIAAKRTAIVASGASFADALAAGPLAYAEKLPVLLTESQQLSPATSAALDALDIEQVLLLGGTGATGATVEAAIAARGIEVRRLGGANRAATAAAIADYAVASVGFPARRANLARGDAFADALAGAPLGGATTTVMLLSASPTTLGEATRDWLRANASTLTGGTIFGGPSAISETVEAAAVTAAGGTPTTGVAGTASAASVTITSGLADGAATNDSTPTYGGVASAASGTLDEVTVSVDGRTASTLGMRCTGCGTDEATWEFTPPAALAEGTHTIAFRAVDNSDAASSPAQTTVVVDLTAPSLAGIEAARGASTISAVFDEPVRCASVSKDDFTASSDAGSLTVYGTSCVGAASTSVGVAIGRALQPGERVSLSGVGSITDPAGNVAPSFSASATVANTDAPLLTVASPANDTYTSQQRPTFEGTADGSGGRAVSSVEFRVGTDKWFSSSGVTCTGCPGTHISWKFVMNNASASLGYYPDGTYTVEIRAKDGNGVFSDVASRTITIDTQRPVFASIAATGGSTTVIATFTDLNGLACSTVAASDFTAVIAGDDVAVSSATCGTFAEGSHEVAVVLASAPAAGDTVSVTLKNDSVADPAGNTAFGTTIPSEATAPE